MAEVELETVFGPESTGATPEERAKTSKRLFVRSQDHLALYRAEATGRILTAWEALEAYDFDALLDAVVDGPTALVVDANEPAESIRSRRVELGITHRKLAAFIGIEQRLVEDAENSSVRSPIRILERIAEALGLDERLLSFQSGSGGDRNLGVRLRSIGSGPDPLYSQNTVLKLDEAAWVIATQHRLASWLKGENAVTVRSRFEPSDQYGSRGYPAWRHGFFLAQKARDILGISTDEPIRELRRLCELVLCIPVIQADLMPRIAGATIANGDSRGIAVNIEGANENVWVRRATIAHELGHLLWDPNDKLDSLRVDDYSQIERDAREELEGADYVEQRANAFAVEFLAPQRAVQMEFGKHRDAADGIRAIADKFGVSYTMARYQVWNSLDRKTPFEALTADGVQPTYEWMGRESFTVDFFPLKGTVFARRGLFSAIVVAAEQKRIVTEDTAVEYLQTSIYEYRKERGFILELFPDWGQIIRQ